MAVPERIYGALRRGENPFTALRMKCIAYIKILILCVDYVHRITRHNTANQHTIQKRSSMKSAHKFAQMRCANIPMPKRLHSAQ